MLLKFKRGLPRHANLVCIKRERERKEKRVMMLEGEREREMYFRKMYVCCSCRYDCLHKKILIFFLSVNKINKSFLSITDDSLVPIHPTHPFHSHLFTCSSSFSSTFIIFFFAFAFVYMVSIFE